MLKKNELAEKHIKRYLKDKKSCVKVFEELDSTNDYAKKLADEGCSSGSVVVAKSQTAGRGRLGRKFFSPSNHGIYMSVVLKPDFNADKLLFITSAAAVAVCRAIYKTSRLETQIKWVNDIYKDGKKLCGILAETTTNAKTNTSSVVVGVGINVTNESFPDEISDIATSIGKYTKKTVNKNKLVALIANELCKICESIEKNKDLQRYDFMEEYRARSCVIGKKVTAICADKSREIYIEDILDSGALLVRDEKGNTEEINSGEISIRF